MKNFWPELCSNRNTIMIMRRNTLGHNTMGLIHFAAALVYTMLVRMKSVLTVLFASTSGPFISASALMDLLDQTVAQVSPLFCLYIVNRKLSN